MHRNSGGAIVDSNAVIGQPCLIDLAKLHESVKPPSMICMMKIGEVKKLFETFSGQILAL